MKSPSLGEKNDISHDTVWLSEKVGKNHAHWGVWFLNLEIHLESTNKAEENDISRDMVSIKSKSRRRPHPLVGGAKILTI